MPPASESAWTRLGNLLAARRIELGARYKNKALFAREREINRRMLWNIESGTRDTYSADTLRAIESAYMLVPGSLDRVLAGGGLEPLPPPRAAVPEPAPARWDDEPQGDAAWTLFPRDRTKRWLWRTPNLTEDERAELIALIDRKRAESAPPERQADAGLGIPPEQGNP
jgi:hypothetical protein